MNNKMIFVLIKDGQVCGTSDNEHVATAWNIAPNTAVYEVPFGEVCSAPFEAWDKEGK